MRPSIRASSIKASIARSFMRAASVRNARPVRISAPSRLRHSDSYARSRDVAQVVLAQRGVERAAASRPLIRP